MAHTTPDVRLNRSTSYTSVADSDTTYHSFHDIELYEPAGPLEPVQVKPPAWKYEAFAPTPMRRQDSGYESIPSDSKSSGSRGATRRTSTTSSRSSNTMRLRTRPSIHRASSLSSQGPAQPPSRPQSQQYHTFTYYHFPDPEECTDGDDDDDEVGDVEPAQYPPPPATTHYWTSDSTRRMEYAAIDAASQGVKGWIMRHVVPDCFIPKNSRRLRFDDDTGSVRRYRLELEEDMLEKEGKSRKRMSWFGR